MMSPPHSKRLFPSAPVPTPNSAAPQAEATANAGAESPSPPPATPTTALSDALAASTLASQTRAPAEESIKVASTSLTRKRMDENDGGRAEEVGGVEGRVSKRRRTEAHMVARWSGRLGDQIIRLDGMTKVGDPVKKFEKEHKIFPQELTSDLHLVLLEMQHWSTHRITSLKQKRQNEIAASLREIEAEEYRQERTRLQLLSAVHKIQRAVVGISEVETLR